MNISIITQPYNEQGKGLGGGLGPRIILEADLVKTLINNGHSVTQVKEIEMSHEDESQYGEWNRVALANSYLATESNKSLEKGDFVLGLFANCNSVLGLLAGMQKSKRGSMMPNRVGLVWIDAHGDYNTPETSPSGMLGGMPVAIAAGKCLSKIRRTSGLKYPLQAPDIIMLGLRDLDDEERGLISADSIVTIGEESMLKIDTKLKDAMNYLVTREDKIYVHVDLDILNPELAPAAGLPTPGGFSGEELGKILRHLISYDKVCGLAMVSYKPERENKTENTRKEIIRAIEIALMGLKDKEEK
jgi:arginase